LSGWKGQYQRRTSDTLTALRHRKFPTWPVFFIISSSIVSPGSDSVKVSGHSGSTHPNEARAHVNSKPNAEEKSLFIKIYPEKCIGAGRCVECAPDVFSQRDSDGIVILLDERPSAERREAVNDAARKCPTSAIEVLWRPYRSLSFSTL